MNSQRGWARAGPVLMEVIAGPGEGEGAAFWRGAPEPPKCCDRASHLDPRSPAIHCRLKLHVWLDATAHAGPVLLSADARAVQ